MDVRQETIKKIKNLLRYHRKGLTITDIAQKLHLNRNSTAKYLEILLISGEVNLNTYGPAKVYTVSQKMPISAMLKFSADIILLVDNEMRVLDANENALSILGMSREDLVGNLIENVNSPLIARLVSPDVFEEIQKTGEIQREFSVARQNEDHHYRVRIIPTVFDNREDGVTIIGEDITKQIRFEESLMISEARYRAIVQDQTDFICRWRPEGEITFINDTLGGFVGISCSAAQGESVFSYIFPEDIPLAKEKITQLTPNQPSMSTELRVRDKEGQYRWLQWHTRCIYDNAGTPVECQSVGRDVTERKRAEESEKERYKELNCLYGISALLELPGSSLNEILKRIVMHLPSGWQFPEITEACIVMEGQTFQTPRFRETPWMLTREIIVNGNPVGQVEVCYLEERQESAEGPFMIEERHLLNAIAERLGRIIERKRAEEALVESEEHYRSLAEQVHEGIFIYQGTRFVVINTGTSEITGYSKDEILTMDFIDLVHPDDRAYVRTIIERRERGEQVPDVYEIRIIRKNGTVRYAELAMSIISYRGGYAVLGTARDTTKRKRAEDALHESEERYRSVVEDQTEFICRFTPDGILTFVNDAYCRYFGLDKGKCIGRPHSVILPHEDAGLVRKHLASLSLKNPAGIIEHRIQMLDGKFMWQRWSDRAIFNNEGQVIEYQSVGRDITTRHEQMQKIRESEERFHVITDLSPFPISIIDDSGNYRFVNKMFTQLFGYTLAEIQTGKDWVLTAFPDSTERSKAMLTGKNDLAHSTTGKVSPSMFPVTCKDGTVLQINFFPVTLQTGEQFIVYEDITPKTESERLRAVLASIVNSSNDAIIGKDLDGTIISWNKAAERIYGYLAEEVIGKSIAVIIAPELREQLSLFLQRIRAGESIDHFKTTRIRKDGSRIEVSVTLSPIKDEQGKVIGISTIAKNISDL